jgi:hypothetical protein
MDPDPQPCHAFFRIIDKSSYLLQDLGRRESNTLRRSQGLSLNPSPKPLDVPPLPGRNEAGPKGRRAGDRKSAGKKSKMAKEAMKADSRSSVASTLKSQEVDVDEEMDIETRSRREEALEAITARNSKLYKSIYSSSRFCRFNFLSGAFRSVSYSLSRSVFCKGTDPYLYLPDCLSVLAGFTFTNALDPSSGTYLSKITGKTFSILLGSWIRICIKVKIVEL